jgi:hypothetical protein
MKNASSQLRGDSNSGGSSGSLNFDSLDLFSTVHDDGELFQPKADVPNFTPGVVDDVPPPFVPGVIDDVPPPFVPGVIDDVPPPFVPGVVETVNDRGFTSDNTDSVLPGIVEALPGIPGLGGLTGDSNGIEIKNDLNAPTADLNKALEDLLNRGALPDLDSFTKRNVPRNDGIIRKREEIDSDGSLQKITEFPNGVSIAKSESNTRDRDGKTRQEIVTTKFPEGAQQRDDGTVVDKNGKPIFKDNGDGARSVFINDAQGKPQTVTEFDNGVRITKGEPETVIKDGQTIRIEGTRTIKFPEGAAKAPDGTVVDQAGNPLLKENQDGSVTVFQKDGAHTHTDDGKLTFKKAPPPGKRR